MNDRQNGGHRDKIDEQLLALLGHNARLSLTALAKEVGLSRTAIQARLAKMERDGTIAGYRAVLGATRKSPSVGAVLAITFSQRPCSPVVAKFRHWPEIEAYYSVTGAIDAYAVIKVGTTQELSGFVHRLSDLSGVASVQSAVIL